MAELLQFTWKRCPQGYGFVYFPESWLKKRHSAEIWSEFLESAPEWVDVDVLPAPSSAGDDFFLLPKSPHLEDFEPLKEEPAIFRNFAGMAETKEAITTFAERFGPILRGNNSLSSWIDEMRQMSLTVKQWEVAQNTGDYRAVRSLINVLDLRARISLELTPGIPEPRLSISPQNLLEALWVQFALAVSGNAQLSQCFHCKAWFQVGGEIGRKHGSLYCSDRCNKAAYERRSERRAGKKKRRKAKT